MNELKQEPKTTKIVRKEAPLLDDIKKADLTRVFIGLGAGVDPDGLASQLAMKTIVKYINPEAKVDCFYRGDFDRAQNRTMREVLALNPLPYSEFQGDQANQEAKWNHPYTTIIMVDGPASVMCHANHGLKPHFIIDHHEPAGEAVIGMDVRMIGSCSAILWEYIMALDPEILDGEEGARLATALAIGVCTDTVDKTVPKTSQLDWRAEGYCGARCDIKAYADIKNYPRPSYQKDMEMQAWRDKQIEGTVLVTPLGLLKKQRKGVISSVAEEFCGQGPVRTTLAAGMINGDLHFSFRSFNSSINADDFIKKTLEAFGGAKPGAGAGVISMPKVCKDLPEELQKQMFEAMFKALCQKMFEFAGDGVRIKDQDETNS